MSHHTTPEEFKGYQVCTEASELIKRAGNAHAFQDKEMKNYQASEDPQCSESQREGEKEVDGKKEEQRRRAIEGVVDITKLCLMEMNQKELGDTMGGP
ncbi:unnamed protein product [Arctogadus glacialis]